MGEAMDPTPSKLPLSPSRNFYRLLAAAAAFVASAFVIDALLHRIQMSPAACVGLALLPLIPGGVFLRVQRQALSDLDELGLHIAREGFAFSFFGLIGLLVCVDIMKNAGVLPGFTWTTIKLLGALVGLALTGVAIAARRYR